jgi:hypothetical protein
MRVCFKNCLLLDKTFHLKIYKLSTKRKTNSRNLDNNKISNLDNNNKISNFIKIKININMELMVDTITELTSKTNGILNKTQIISKVLGKINGVDNNKAFKINKILGIGALIIKIMEAEITICTNEMIDDLEQSNLVKNY